MSEKRRNEVVAAKLQEVRDAAKAIEVAEKECEGEKFPLPEQEIEIEEGGIEPHTSST